MKKKILLVSGIIAVVFLSYLVLSVVSTGTDMATAAKQTYNSTLYVAGMGGHYAKVDVTIDPNNEKDPIKVKNLDRITIGDKKTHPTHDARIDSNDSAVMFWSTYVLDPNGKMHVGKSDLKTGKVIKDVALDPDPRAPGKKPPLYCASGQSKDNYLPIFMGVDGFVDIFDKKNLDHKKRMFISDIGFKAGTYQFLHGVNSNDHKTFLLAINETKDGKGTGKIDFVLVDLPALEKGEWKVITKASHTGVAGKTITFRGYFSNDNKVIFQSVGDRIWVLDGKTLAMVDEKMVDGQIHDAQATPDNKYVVMTVRQATDGCDNEGKAIPGKTITDGTVQMYDVDGKKVFGNQVSVCQACHKGLGLGDKSAVLCGIDSVYSKK